MSGFKSQFSQFPTFIQEGAVYTPNQIPTQMPPQQMPPQPPPQIPSSGVPFIPPKRKSPLKVILLTLLIIIILSGAGLGAVLGMRVWDPMWNPFRPKPQAVFDQAILKMNDITKYGYKVSGDVSLNATDNNSNNTIKAQGSFNSGGSIDISDILNPKLDSVLDFIFSLSTPDPDEKMGVSSAGAVRALDNNLYFKISKFEATGSAVNSLEDYISSFTDIKDKWAKIIKEQIGSAVGQGGEIPSYAKQKELENQIKAILVKYPSWQASEQLADETIGGKSVYHYVISLNKGNVEKSISEIIKLGAESDYSLAMAEGFVSTFFEKVGEVKADIWIGKKDLLVYKFNFEKAIDLKQVVETVAGDLSVGLNLEMSDHNKPVVVAIPSGVKSVEEVYGPVIKKVESNAKNDKIQSDINRIRTLSETIFSAKKSYSSLSCKAKDVDALCSDIKAQTGEDPKVFGYYKKYCAYAKLLKLNDSDKQEYYCIDYNLSAIKTDIDPSLKGYCTGYAFECPKPSVSPSPSPSPTPNL
jgi:hypothetical protein